MTGKPFHTVREGVSCLDKARSLGEWLNPEGAGTDGGLCPSAWAKVGSLVAGDA